jgi:hypothetical protein
MDPEGWTIGDWSRITPRFMREYSEEFLNYVSEQGGGTKYDTWAREEIARRQTVRLAELITVLNQATDRVQTEVTGLTTSSTHLEDLTKTLRNLTWVLIVLTFIAAALPVGVEIWKARHEQVISPPPEPPLP